MPRSKTDITLVRGSGKITDIITASVIIVGIEKGS